jgi:hypothetical protein
MTDAELARVERLEKRVAALEEMFEVLMDPRAGEAAGPGTGQRYRSASGAGPMKRFVYRLLKWSNDVNAVRRGKVGCRVARRVYGKFTGRLARKLFG